MIKKITLICIYIFILFLSTELLLRLSGWKEVPQIYEEINDPDIRWVHRVGFEGRVWDTDVKINSQGLRDREYPFDKPKDTFRIFAVGECTTFGQAVALEDSFVKKLEVMLNNRKPLRNFKHYEVINGGLREYDDLQKIYFLKKYGLRYHPDLIIFSHDLGDKIWVEPRAALRWFRLMVKSTPKQIYSIRYLFINIGNIIREAWENKLSKSGERQFIEYRYTGVGLSHFGTCQALKELALLSQERHIPALVVFLPWLENLAEDRYPYKWAHEFFNKECRKNNLPLLDLYEAYFKNKQADLYWVSNQNRWPNAIAHRIIAEQVYQELIRLGLLRQE